MPSERYEIIITSKGSRTVKRDFDSVAKSADRTGKAAERTGKTLDTSMRRGGAAANRAGADYRRLSRDVNRVGQSGVVAAGRMRALTRSLVVPSAANASLLTARRNVRGLVGAFSAFYAVRFIGETADSFTRMNNALRGFGVGANSVDRVRKAVTGLSNDARVDAEQAVVLFGRLRLATRDLGLTTKDVLGLTGTINKALRLSGSSALEASQSIRQLSQAFNKGKLDGDEFRSVLENAPILTRLLSDELGISKRELRDWAEDGKISVKVLANALAAGQAEIDAAFGNLTPTLGDAFKVLNNKIREFVGTTPAFTTSMRIASKALQLVGDNLSAILGLLEAIAAVKIGKSILNLARDLGGARAIGAIAAGLSAAPAAAVGAAGIAGGAGAVPFANVVGPQAAAAGLAAGTARGVGIPIKSTEKAIASATSEAKKLNVVVGTGLSGAFKKVLTFAGRIGSRVKGLLSPFNILAATLGAMVIQIGKGFLGSLKEVTGETSAWEAVVVSISALWDMLSVTIGGVADYMLSKISGVLKAIMFLINTAFAEALGAATVLGGLIEDPSVILDSKALGALQQSGRDVSKAFMDGVKNGTDGMDVRLQQLGAGWGKSFSDIIKPSLAKRDYDKALAPFYETLAELDDVVRSLEIADRFAEQFKIAPKDLMELSKVADSLLNDTNFQPSDKISGILAGRKGGEQGELLKAAKSLDEYTQSLNAIKDAFLPTAEAALKAAEPSRFEDFGDKPTDIQELNQVAAAATALNGYLKTTLEAFSGLEAAVREAEGSGGKEGVRAAIENVKTKIDKVAEGLPPPIAQAAREAANLMVSEAEAVLTQGATVIAASVKAAFLSALVPGLAAVANQLNLPGQDGPSGIGTSTNLILPTETSDEIKKNSLAVQDLTKQYGNLSASLNDYSNRSAASFRKATGSAKNAASEIEQFFGSAFGSLEDALVGFVTTGKLDFKSLINSIIADLARMVIRMLIIKPLMGFFGGLFGFAGGGVVPGFANGGIVKGFATGGVINGFGGAKSDNQLIAASPGEMIINKRATDDNIGALQYINKTGMMPPSPNKQGGIVYAPVINVQSDSGGDGQATAQMIDAAIRRSWDELAIKAQRKGGVFG